jgi:hypothetical protein
VGPRQKILSVFAVIGFLIGPAILYYSSRENLPDRTLLAILCPPSRLSLALQGSPAYSRVVGWGFLSAVNAFLYVLLGLLVAVLVTNSNS